jgi:glycerol-1-phosphate dehydrogenase [NAD(P)+]
VDIFVLAGAPPAMKLAGFGDHISMWTAEWYPASAVGMYDSYHEATVALVRERGRELLANAARLRGGDADLLFYAGRWDGAFVARLLEHAHRAGGPL